MMRILCSSRWAIRLITKDPLRGAGLPARPGCHVPASHAQCVHQIRILRHTDSLFHFHPFQILVRSTRCYAWWNRIRGTLPQLLSSRGRSQTPRHVHRARGSNICRSIFTESPSRSGCERRGEGTVKWRGHHWWSGISHVQTALGSLTGPQGFASNHRPLHCPIQHTHCVLWGGARDRPQRGSGRGVVRGRCQGRGSSSIHQRPKHIIILSLIAFWFGRRHCQSSLTGSIIDQDRTLSRGRRIRSRDAEGCGAFFLRRG